MQVTFQNIWIGLTRQKCPEIKDVFEQDQGKLWSICQVNLDNYSVSNINYVYECIFEAKPSGGYRADGGEKVVLESILLENLAHTSDAEISAIIIEKILPYIDEIYHGVTVVYNSSMISDGIKTILTVLCALAVQKQSKSMKRCLPN